MPINNTAQGLKDHADRINNHETRIKTNTIELSDHETRITALESRPTQSNWIEQTTFNPTSESEYPDKIWSFPLDENNTNIVLFKDFSYDRFGGGNSHEIPTEPLNGYCSNTIKLEFQTGMSGNTDKWDVYAIVEDGKLRFYGGDPNLVESITCTGKIYESLTGEIPSTYI